MRIQSTILSLQAQRYLSRTTKAFARAMERLASGTRANSAVDGASEISRASGLTAQIRGAQQIIRSLNDGKGTINTYEGVISTQLSIVQRMRELAIQSSNGILSIDERSYLSGEFNQLLQEYNRLTDQAEFNGVKIADGSFGIKKLLVNANTSSPSSYVDLTLPSLKPDEIFLKELNNGTFEAGPLKVGASGNAWSNYGDINNDGILDYVLNWNTGNSSFAYIGRGDGTFLNPITMPIASGITMHWGTLEDVNNDDNLDFLATSSNGVILAYLGNGNGTFKTPTTLAGASGGGNEMREIETGDFDNDGNMDLIVADFLVSGTVSVFMGNGDGTFEARRTIAANSYALEPYDFNGDGRLDFAVNSSFTTIFLGDGQGSFSAGQTIAGNGGDFAIGDINNDGIIDLGWGDTGGQTFYAVTGNGDGTFSSAATYYSPDGWIRSARFADMNGDGNLDAVWTSDTAAVATILYGKGDGTFGTRQTFFSPTSLNSHADDFDGDGDNDILLPGYTGHYIYLGKSSLKPAARYLDISTQEAASDALDVLENGINQLTLAAAQVGAISQRLNSIENSTQSLVQSLVESKSILIDTDYAQEMSEIARLQIMRDFAIAAQTQAQLSQKQIISLINFN